jgi:hypothetical protein
MKKYIFLFLAIFFTLTGKVFAIDLATLSNMPVTVKVTPVFGFEQSRSVYPDNSVEWKLMYGINVSIGNPLISAEITGLKSTSNKTKLSEKIDDSSDIARLGLVSKIYLIPQFGIIIRAGGQGEKRVVKVTPQGEDEYIYYKKVHYSPYAGGGFSFPLSTNTALEFMGNAVFKDFPNNLSDTSLDYTVRVKVAF